MTLFGKDTFGSPTAFFVPWAATDINALPTPNPQSVTIPGRQSGI